jgi:hypothetical protein
MDKLDEKGFVFIDDNSRPFWCCMYFGNPMYMYWHEAQKSWVTLRVINQVDIWRAYEKKIPDDQAEIYHKQHSEFENRFKHSSFK